MHPSRHISGFPGIARVYATLCALLAGVAMPVLAQEPEPSPTPKPTMEVVGNGVYRIGKITLDKNAKTVRFPVKLNMDDGLMEYLLVTPQGSAHESLLTAEIQPTDLHFAMLLLGAKGAGPTAPDPSEAPPTQIDASYLKTAPKLKGDPVEISVSWTKDGATTSARIEDLILNKDAKKPMARAPWIYNGSLFVGNRFLAQSNGSFIALVTNPAALINSPSKDSDNDLVWIPNKPKLPANGTAMEICLKLQSADSK